MRRIYQVVVIILSCLFVVTNLELPMFSAATTPTAQVEVILEEPAYSPPIGACDETYWYEITNDRGYKAYLTLNAYDTYDTTNSAEWIPTLPEAGYYRVEAYVPLHDPIIWCVGDDPDTYDDDTTDARYTIHHGFGETTVSRDQSPLANEWLDLGEYYFNAGTAGKVVLTDLNGEEEFTTTISFSAMRFTWTRQSPQKRVLPMVFRNQVPTRTPDPNPWYGVQADPAFDACHMGGVSTMQAWWDSSPYRIVGLYLGGISYPVHDPVNCTVITQDWVQQVRDMGWTFIPTWAGPQAPCTSYKHQMDEDPAVTYLQGRSEAEAASQAASDLGLTSSTLGGTIIYYDLEAFGSIPEECKLAVDAFMNGWTECLHELGNLSGGYGSACSSYPIRWITLDNPPDDVWLAYWTEDEYDPNQTVYGLPCFADSYYTNHQRIKQYAGGHDESWGGKTLEIDSNVADAQVAMPIMPLSHAADIDAKARLPGDGAIQQTGWLSPRQGWLLSDGRLYLTGDAGVSWEDQGLKGIQRFGFLDDGTIWAAGSDVFYRWSALQESWQSLSLPEEVNDWRVIQVGLTDNQNGWLVMQLPTSTIFSVAKLLRTSNGGSTWLLSDLPFAASVRWTDMHTGWLSGGISGRELYHTTDSGKSWQPVRLSGDLDLDKTLIFLGEVQQMADGVLMIHATLSHVKVPYLMTYISNDGGQNWQFSSSKELSESAPMTALPQAGEFISDGPKVHSLSADIYYAFEAPVVQMGSNREGLVWLVTRHGVCQGDKEEPGFSCASQDSLWLSSDGGVTWDMLLP